MVDTGSNKALALFTLVLGGVLLGHPGNAQAQVAPAGWYAGDIHVHRSCSGAPESVESIKGKMDVNNLAVISLLADMGNGEVLDPVTDLPKVNGQDDPISTTGRIVHWDAEWHWDATYTQFPHQALGGHLLALGLNQAEQVWEEYTFPIMEWAKARNGITGFAHMQYAGDAPPQTLDCCTPIEYPVEVALGAADFISQDVNGSDTFMRAYYRLLNSGFRPGFAAGSDYPCGVDGLGGLLTYARPASGEMAYRGWIEAIAAGRTVVSRNGQKEFLALTVNADKIPGDEIQLTAGGAVSASVQWTASQSFSGTLEIVRNGVVVASQAATAGPGAPVTLTSSVSFPRSGWLVARVMDGGGHRVHTAAVFVIVGGSPIRASVEDAQFYVTWIDQLLAKTAPGGVWANFFTTSRDAARARYQAARDIFAQRAAEAAAAPPTVTSVTPASGASNVYLGTTVSATFSEALAPATVNGSTFELRDGVGQLVPASVSWSAGTNSAVLDPDITLDLLTTYTATVKGGASGVTDAGGTPMEADFTWTFTTQATPSTGPYSIWDGGGTPAQVNQNDGQAIELGVKFRSSEAGYVTALRFYKGSQDNGTHVGTLWSSAGAPLATATFTGETASGWQEVALSTPVEIAANTTYVASYHSSAGYYVATGGYFTQAVTNGPLTALADGTDGGNGLYRYGASGFPTSSWNASNYWVDVVFSATPSGSDTTPPTVASTIPANGASAVFVGATIAATFSEALDPATVTGATVYLRDGGGVDVPATVAWNAATTSATLQPTSPLAFSTTYIATVVGGTGGVTDAAGNPLAVDFTWSFTTQAPSTGTYSIWNGTGTPALVNQNDGQALELGVKFRSSEPGYVTALRFYKGSQDNGTHVGNLWTSGGTLLATVTFTGETASGWQEVALSTPVAIAANTTYVASYHSSAGYYVATTGYFTQTVTNGPLTALADGTDGPNGLYKYGTSGFPTTGSNASNYWVDLVFSATPPGPDTTPPTVVSTSPANGASGVLAGATVSARFSEPLDPATVSGATAYLRGPGGTDVPATVAWSAATNSITLQPTSPLAYETVYTATVTGGVTDVAGNALEADFTWSFTTQAPPPPPPTEGPGGPILVITASSRPFSTYYAEILRTEGLNAFTTLDITAVDSSVLAQHDVAILAEMPLSSTQVTMLTDWVNAGGNLIAMRPDKQLAGLLGLTDLGTTLPEAYMLVNTAAAPGQGIVGQTIQFHGTADRYTRATGTTAVATLYSSATTATPNPAVTLRSVGAGRAAAFTFDLARSIVYTRQGNPAWAGQKRDGLPGPIRSDDLFWPDWVNLSKVAIPQADEQQRLLANLILTMNADRKPLPRFWYFPRGEKAVVVMAVDNHGSENVEPRFQAEEAVSPSGCSVDNWECVRSSAYIYLSGIPDDATAKIWEDKGFELGVHVNTNCDNWTPASLADFYSNDLASFRAKFPSLALQTTHRTHCIAWSDWATQPKVSLANGIRFDTNYYYWPPDWVNDTPGFFTGSGMPMRFADLDGTMIDVYQATTQMTDESGQTYPFTADTLLDRAIGAEGYYGAFVANIHSDGNTNPQADAIIASALARSVPVVSAKQMLTWIDGRNGSTFENLTWTGDTLTFGISVGGGANGLQAMLPAQGGGNPLTSLTRGGLPVSYTTQTIKGISYAVFEAAAGTYQATYGAPTSYTLTVTPPTNGTVSGTGILCGTGGSDCTETVSPGTLISLIATPDANHVFAGWSGDCSGTSTCDLTMNASKTVSATFAVVTYTLTVTPPTLGTITGSGINCGLGGSTCAAVFDSGTNVPLTATAAPGYQLAGWTGDCPGGLCTMTANRTAGATFTVVPVPVRVNDASATEGNCGTTDLTFTVTLDTASPAAVTVTYQTEDAASALAGQDYVARTGQIVIPAGQTSWPVAIQILGDVTFEPNETFTLRLTAATNGTLADDTGVGTITNDDLDPASGVEAVVWTQTVGVSACGSSLTKTTAWGWGNAGAVSTRALAPGDGYAEFTIPAMAGEVMFGLSHENTGQAYADIDFAFFTYSPSSSLLIYENGVYRGGFGTYSPGDKLRVSLESGVVRYRRNGTLLYTSTVAPTAYPLLIDTALKTTGAIIENASLAGTIVDAVAVLPTENVVWTNAVGVDVSANSLMKTAAWGWGNAGAVSTRALAPGNGYAEFTIPAMAGEVMFGLSHENTDETYADIDFAFFTYSPSSSLLIYENGVYRGAFGTYAVGDKIRVSVESGVVKYRRNGTLLYTSTVAPTAYPLLIDTALKTTGAIIENAILGGNTVNAVPVLPTENVVWTSAVGVDVSANSLTKTASWGWGNAGAVSTRALAPGDGYAEFTIPAMAGEVMFGLSHDNTGQTYAEIDFAFFTYSPSSSLLIYENGVYRGAFGTYAVGDKIRVSVESGVVKYRRNGTLLYTSTVAPTAYPLLIDTALKTTGAIIENAILGGTVGPSH